MEPRDIGVLVFIGVVVTVLWFAFRAMFKDTPPEAEPTKRDDPKQP
jgi:cbb3-type cytochrome oxidase subunit 3